MIDRLKNIISKAKYLTLTIADQGDQVQITATVRPKDGSDPAKPIQVKADWQIADALLVEALNKPPKPGKTELKKEPKAEAENSGDLFAAAEAAEEKTAGSNGESSTDNGESSADNGESSAADDESKTKTEEN